MMKKIIAEISGAAIKNTSDSFKSIMTAITAAPITRKGARTASLINILTPFWTVFVSFVSLFTSDAVPILSTLQQEQINEFNKAVDEISDCSISVGKISAILNPVSFMIMNLGIVAIIWFGGIRIDSGSLMQGELIAFTNYMTQILLALVVVANLIVTFTKAFASANRVSEVFELAPEKNGTEHPDNFSENIIEFKNVSFRYESAGENSLHNISFTLKRGEMLGIIGGTGSGKSTIASLIPCFYPATEGEVIVSDLCDICIKSIGHFFNKFPCLCSFQCGYYFIVCCTFISPFHIFPERA